MTTFLNDELFNDPNEHRLRLTTAFAFWTCHIVNFFSRLIFFRIASNSVSITATDTFRHPYTKQRSLRLLLEMLTHHALFKPTFKGFGLFSNEWIFFYYFALAFYLAKRLGFVLCLTLPTHAPTPRPSSFSDMFHIISRYLRCYSLSALVAQSTGGLGKHGGVPAACLSKHQFYFVQSVQAKTVMGTLGPGLDLSLRHAELGFGGMRFGLRLIGLVDGLSGRVWRFMGSGTRK